MATLAPLNAWTLAADILNPPVWEPKNRPPLLAHQVAPAMGWRLWLMLGGRGSGKTEGCSRYFARYMRTHPGHRGRIIAPTLGDAVAACVEGPSGLLAIDPEIRFVPSAPGGAKLIWPNGSVAFLIGTPTPREVDRLRAAGNVHCLRGDTPVLTENGWQSIAEVLPGERVVTRLGLRRVLRAGMTGVRATLRLVTASGRELVGTDDHPILTDRGWVPLGLLTPVDMIWSCPVNGSSGAAEHGTAAVTATSAAASGYSTARSGSTITARSRTGCTSITATATKPTTGSRTWSWSPRSGTPNTTRGGRLRASAWRSSPRGSAVAPSRTGTTAMSVASSSPPRRTSPRGSVGPNAAKRSTSGPRPAGGRGATRCAWSVVRPSAPVGTFAPARDRVRAVSPTGLVEPVWDLEVEEAHEFVAAGLIVHNCDWWEEMAANPQLDKAWVQAQFGLRLGDHPHSIASTTPRVRDRLVKLLRSDTTAVTRATIFDNPHLSEQVKADLLAEYEGTRMGRQELYGELLEDIEGALWTWAMVEAARELWNGLEVDENDAGLLVPAFTRAGVAIDPAVTSTEESDVVGIIGGGLVTPRLGAIVLDRSVQGVRPREWARRGVQAFDDLEADRLIAETNQGGELVEETLRVLRPAIPYRSVHASRGKRTRAEPVSAQWEQGRWALGPGLDDLAAELTGWDPETSTESPGRLDAMVWLSTWLMPPGSRPARTSVPRGSIQGRGQRRTMMQGRIG